MLVALAIPPMSASIFVNRVLSPLVFLVPLVWACRLLVCGETCPVRSISLVLLYLGYSNPLRYFLMLSSVSGPMAGCRLFPFSVLAPCAYLHPICLWWAISIVHLALRFCFLPRDVSRVSHRLLALRSAFSVAITPILAHMVYLADF